MIVVFEGIDGSGKGTQSKKLSEYLTSRGESNALYSFPNYKGTSFGVEIGKYLNGGFGDMKSLPPEFPAMLYALDRFEMKDKILSSINSKKHVIFDRYVESNFAYQAAKLSKFERKTFIDWVKRLEYNILSVPEPDKVIFLDANPEITSKLVLKKEKRSYTDAKEDMHEKDISYMKSVYDLYKEIAHEEKWCIIPCVDDGVMRDAEEIFSDIKCLFNS